MPEKKTILAKMLIDEQKARGMTDREVAAELGVLQQTYSTWKANRVPRDKAHDAIAAFLRVSSARVAELADEASVPDETHLSAYASARVYGRVSDRKEGKFKFDTSRKKVPEGRYAIVVDTKVMEPAFRVGLKAWLDPSVWPKVGDDVIAHSRGVGWIGRLAELGTVVRLERYSGEPVEVKDVDAVHVIVLAERV